MPKRAGSPKRYAEAIFDLAREHGEIEEWITRLQTLNRILNEAPEFVGFLQAPGVGVEEKVQVIQHVFADENPRLQNLLSLLTFKQHVGLVPEILAQYRQMANDALGIEIARVTTAVPLDDTERHRIVNRLEVLVGRTVQIEERVDPAILGGFVARIRDWLLDGSARTRLNDLRRQLIVGPM